MRTIFLITAAGLLSAAMAASLVARDASEQTAKPTYTADVRPFMKQYCQNCHNHQKAKAGYDVEDYAGLTRGRRPLVVPNQPGQSRLLATLQGRGKRMPPRKSPQPTAAEIDKMKAWIEAGAADDSAKQR